MSHVLVTGCSAGIGLATALTLARSGHTVCATMRNLDRGSFLRETVETEKLSVLMLPLDVDSDESVTQALSAIRSRIGFIEVLVNNAGIEHTGSIEELPLQVFRATMETNYFGALRCIRACLPEMRERRSGCIVNVTSVAGRIATSPLAPYVASKFALEALSEALAQEVKPFDIRVAIVEPGIIATAMADRIATAPQAARSECIHPHPHRIAGLFRASAVTATSPAVVAEAISVESLKIKAGGSDVLWAWMQSHFSNGERRWRMKS